MPIRIRCPNPDCGAVYVAPDGSEGRSFACPKCRGELLIPAATAGDVPVTGARIEDWRKNAPPPRPPDDREVDKGPIEREDSRPSARHRDELPEDRRRRPRGIEGGFAARLAAGIVVGGVLLIVVVVVAVRNGGKGNQRGSAPTQITRAQFRQAVMYKTPQQVAGTVGYPDKTAENDLVALWYYYDRTYDPVTGRTDSVRSRAKISYRIGLLRGWIS